MLQENACAVSPNHICSGRVLPIHSQVVLHRVPPAAEIVTEQRHGKRVISVEKGEKGPFGGMSCKWGTDAASHCAAEKKAGTVIS